MSARRTQIYLTQSQRVKLEEVRRREDKTLAEVIREAVDKYLEDEPLTVDEALESSFGACPDLTVPPRTEWDRGYG